MCCDSVSFSVSSPVAPATHHRFRNSYTVKYTAQLGSNADDGRGQDLGTGRRNPRVCTIGRRLWNVETYASPPARRVTPAAGSSGRPEGTMVAATAPAPAPASALLTCGSVTARAASYTTRRQPGRAPCVSAPEGARKGARARWNRRACVRGRRRVRDDVDARERRGRARRSRRDASTSCVDPDPRLDARGETASSGGIASRNRAPTRPRCPRPRAPPQPGAESALSSRAPIPGSLPRCPRAPQTPIETPRRTRSRRRPAATHSERTAARAPRPRPAQCHRPRTVA